MIMGHIFGATCSGLFAKPLITMYQFVVVFVLAVVAAANAGVYAPVVAAHSALVSPAHFGYAGHLTGVVVPDGSGLEGQYVPDHSELLYDDGSYKPEIRSLPLSASPYGLVVAGSGLEGQYVNDLTEKLYDDGSYRPEHYYHH